MSREEERKGDKRAMKPRGLLLLLALTIPIWGTGMLLPPVALCQPEGEQDGSGATASKKKTKDEKTVRRTLRMDEIEIYGDVEKPKTMFVIPRASLRYSRKDQEKDFTGEILGPITKEWVEDTQRWRENVPPP
jgi:hypothetical protein